MTWHCRSSPAERDGGGMARCERCQAEVFWIRMSPRGTPNPIDYRSVDDGDIAIVGDVGFEVKEVQRFEYRQRGQRLWASHLRWCKPDRGSAA